MVEEIELLASVPQRRKEPSPGETSRLPPSTAAVQYGDSAKDVAKAVTVEASESLHENNARNADSYGKTSKGIDARQDVVISNRAPHIRSETLGPKSYKAFYVDRDLHVAAEGGFIE